MTGTVTDGTAVADVRADAAGTDAATTHLPVKAPAQAGRARVRFGTSREERLTVWGAAGAGLGMGVFLAGVLEVIGWGWVPVVSYFWFVGFYAVLTFLQGTGPAVRDRFWQVVLRSTAVVVVGSLTLVVVFTVLRGWPVVSDAFAFHAGKNPLHFITEDMSGVGPLDGIDTGGILYALVGTLEQIGIALVITVPLGLVAAVFLGEIGGRYARVVRTIVEAMTALPSVVAGLFIYAFIILTFTHESSGFAAALALTVLMLPIMIRSADVVLRLVPGNLREAGLALGASQFSTVWRVVLPTVRSGLTTAIILATAHGIGETAPVLLTSGVTSILNANPFANNQTSLPLAALEYIEAGTNSLVVRGYATAAFLLVVVLVLFLLARIIGGRGDQGASSGQIRRIGRKSRRTLRRLQRNNGQPLPGGLEMPHPEVFGARGGDFVNTGELS
ncbi:MAG: ABC transporter permease subunit [Actinomycetia bacterium]|nr:ABC transporter permease subunit [Actinomycetes bacterium]